MVLGTAVEDTLRSKRLYRVFLCILKVIPMLIAVCDMLNTLLWLMGIDAWWLSYIGGISILSMAFLYVSSIVFKFCTYHRLFLHYILCSNIISTIDYYYEICLDGIVYLIIISIFLFLLLYFHQKETKKR